MGDVYDSSFIVPYPAEDVYGLGVAGPPAEKPAADSVEGTEQKAPEEVSQSENGGAADRNGMNGSGAENYETNLGRNVDVTV